MAHADGWAPIGAGDSLLFTAASRRFGMFEADDLFMLDCSSGKVWLVAPNVVVMGPAVYFR